MSWIREVADGEGPEHLQALYDRGRDPDTARVDYILTVHSLHPAGLQAHLELYEAVMAGTRSLRRADREMIALVVSAANRCSY